MIDPYTAIGHFVVGFVKGALGGFGVFLLCVFVRLLYESIRNRKKAKR